MPSDSEYPFGLLLAGGVSLPILALNVRRVADLLGVGLFEAVALQFAVPLAVAFGLAVVVRDRLHTRRRWVRFVGGIAVLIAMLELAAVGVAVGGVGRWGLIELVAIVAVSILVQRFGMPTTER